MEEHCILLTSLHFISFLFRLISFCMIFAKVNSKKVPCSCLFLIWSIWAQPSFFSVWELSISSWFFRSRIWSCLWMQHIRSDWSITRQNSLETNLPESSDIQCTSLCVFPYRNYWFIISADSSRHLYSFRLGPCCLSLCWSGFRYRSIMNSVSRSKNWSTSRNWQI